MSDETLDRLMSAIESSESVEVAMMTEAQRTRMAAKLNPLLADEIDRLHAALAEARDKALEEAAKEADGFVAHWGLAYKTMTDQIVAAIRALKEKP